MSILYMDLETTDKSPETAHAVELAAALYARGTSACVAKELTHSVLYRPPVPIPPEASAIHHLVDEDVADCHQVGEDDHNTSWLARLLDQTDILAGHNLRDYDLPILRREFPTLFGACDIAVLDTLRLARQVWPDLPSYALQVLRYRFNLPPLVGSDPHRASFDAHLCAGLVEHVRVNMVDFQEMADGDGVVTFTVQPRLRTKEPIPLGRGATMDLALADLSWQAIPVMFMPFGKCGPGGAETPACHKDTGVPVEELPRDYVRWLAKQDWFKPEHPDLHWTLKGIFGRR
jgi:exodeoxyribonuclease X